MADDQTQHEQVCKDFLISYAGKDRGWAEWIAFTLEEAGYQTYLAAWDVRPGNNVVVVMSEATKLAERVLLVLSETYLTASEMVAEWAVAFLRDPTGKDGRVVPVY